MRAKTYQPRFATLKNVQPIDPALKRLSDWLPVNKTFHQNFREWLLSTSCSPSTINIYSVASRYAFGLLEKPYWLIDPEEDLKSVGEWLRTRPITASTLDCYRKGLVKLAEYLRLRCHKPQATKEINWEYFIGPLPVWLQDDVRSLVACCRRNWTADRRFERSRDLLCSLTRPLRWIAAQYPLEDMSVLTPQTWFAYLDARLADGVNPTTTNRELAAVKHLVYHLRDQGRTVCERLLLVDYLEESANLPRDVPLEQLRTLLREIRRRAASPRANLRRDGRMDLAWFLLMLHSGLRTGEVRFLRLADIDWEGKRVRIEQSKGLKDRLVFLSQETIAALQAYLDVRGPMEALPENLFIFQHMPLSISYCFERLHTYGKHYGIYVNPHQLRHSNATLLLNAGAPVLAVQTLLGHKWVDTTLGYARLYDGTVAADYYQAMAVVERQLALPEDCLSQPLGIGQLLALVDSLREGTLNASQIEAVRVLRAGIQALAEKEEGNRMKVVKVPNLMD
jgi:site-specific recombinase XerD